MAAAATKKRPARSTQPAAPAPDPVRAKDFADALEDALLFAGKDYTLPVLAAIRLETDGKQMTLVGTNRYVLGVRTLALPSEPFEFILSRTDTRDLIGLLRTRAGVNKRGPEVFLTVRDDTLTVSTEQLDVRYIGLPFEFPKWRGLVDQIRNKPATEDVGTFAVNATFLAQFSKVSVICQGTPLVVKTTGPTNGVQFTVGKQFWGCQMPVRLSEQPDEMAA